jgi:hypothetical protein
MRIFTIWPPVRAGKVGSRRPFNLWRLLLLDQFDCVSIERHADAPFLAPNDVAGLVQAVGLNDQLEPVRYIDRTLHLKCRTGGRQVFHGAANGPAPAELDRSSLEYALSARSAVLYHAMTVRQKLKNCAKRDLQIRTVGLTIQSRRA